MLSCFGKFLNQPLRSMSRTLRDARPLRETMHQVDNLHPVLIVMQPVELMQGLRGRYGDWNPRE